MMLAGLIYDRRSCSGVDATDGTNSLAERANKKIARRNGGGIDRSVADLTPARPETTNEGLVYPENQKVFKILRRIESCGTCIKH